MRKLLNEIQPVSLQDAINFIVQNLEDGEREYVIMNGAESLHFSAGMAIRNSWIHGDTLFAQHMASQFLISHPDDMSGLILAGVTAAVCKEPYDPYVLAEEYRQFWKAAGIDPVTGTKLL